METSTVTVSSRYGPVKALWYVKNGMVHVQRGSFVESTQASDGMLSGMNEWLARKLLQRMIEKAEKNSAL